MILKKNRKIVKQANIISNFCIDRNKFWRYKPYKELSHNLWLQLFELTEHRIYNKTMPREYIENFNSIKTEKEFKEEIKKIIEYMKRKRKDFERKEHHYSDKFINDFYNIVYKNLFRIINNKKIYIDHKNFDYVYY